MPRRLIILGSTGSIGTQSLDVVEHINALHAAGRSPVRFEVVGIAAGGGNTTLLAEQARRFKVGAVACPGAMSRADLPAGCQVFGGPTAAEDLVRSVDCDMVVAAIVGTAGLPATLAAVQEGRDVALANKETLVAAGELVVPLAHDPAGRVRLLPIDSEHAALWQCLLAGQGPRAAEDDPHPHEWCPPWVRAPGLKRAVLTASGGPFRTWPRERLDTATVADALKHPTWSMGAKVSVDSASLMNKTLEVIEAHWLFGLDAEQIEVLIHPQSLVHAMAEFVDGSVVAQLAAPDMRTPIQRALCYPRVIHGAGKPLDWHALSGLSFEAPDLDRFPALRLAPAVIERGGTAGAILNGANEEAVAAFLHSARGGPRIAFPRIAEVVGAALEEIPSRPLRSLEDCAESERAAREFVRRHLGLPCAAHA